MSDVFVISIYQEDELDYSDLLDKIKETDRMYKERLAKQQTIDNEEKKEEVVEKPNYVKWGLIGLGIVAVAGISYLFLKSRNKPRNKPDGAFHVDNGDRFYLPNSCVEDFEYLQEEANDAINRLKDYVDNYSVSILDFDDYLDEDRVQHCTLDLDV